MANRMSGKQRAERIPLDYFKTRDRLTTWKLRLSGLALVAALGWWVIGFVPGLSRGEFAESDSARLRYSHGPLARVHATWDAKCDACHAPFQPISKDAWTSSIGMGATDSDTKCQLCHEVQDHHANQIPSEVASCAGCHRDHRGRDASLVRLADSECVSCHRDLKDHVRGRESVAFSDASAFPLGHDEFRMFRDGAKSAKDPGTVAFNHALHMTPGLNEAEAGKPVLTLGQLAEADRHRYEQAGQGPGDAVKLDCASCHRTGDGDRPPSTSGGDGSYMRPVSFANDCAACHKLVVSTGQGAPPITVPHRVQPPAIREFLRDAIVGRAMGDEAKSTPGRRVLPGRAERPSLPDRERVDVLAKKADRQLFGPGKAVCSECHRTSGDHVAKASIPSSWFTHARFDHPSHRGVSCRECHASAYPGKDASRTSTDVMLPSKATCARCHAPEGRDADGLAFGGAGHSCTECHRYHGEHAPPPKPEADGMAIRAFLRGGDRGTK